MSLDATCSGISIAAGLIGDENLLLLTNVLQLENSTEKQDFYTHLLIVMTDLFIKSDKSGIIKCNGFELLVNITLELLKDRDLGKFFSMKYTYNETS